MLLAPVGVADAKAWDKDALDAGARPSFRSGMAAVRMDQTTLLIHLQCRGRKPVHRHKALRRLVRRLASVAQARFLRVSQQTTPRPPNSLDPCDTRSDWLRIQAQRIEIPGIGTLRLSRPWRETCWVKRAVATLRGSRWFASVRYEISKQMPEPGSNPGGIVGTGVAPRLLAVFRWNVRSQTRVVSGRPRAFQPFFHPVFSA